MNTRSETLSSLKVAGLYTGTVVGAGFASGQEVLQFFAHFGVQGVWGLALATVLYMIYGWLIMLLGHRFRATSHLEVVCRAGGRVGNLIDWIITLFLVGAFTAMGAGAGAVFEEQFGLPAVLGSSALIAASAFTVLLGIRNVVSIISIVTPLLLATVGVVSLVALSNFTPQWGWFQPEAAPVPSWPLSAIVYVSFNLVLAIALLAPTGTLASETSIRRGAILGGLGLGFGALAIHLAILTAMPEATSYDIPMLLLASRTLGPLAPLYSLVLLLAVYTTAVAALFGFVARIVEEEGSDRTTVTLLTAGVAFLGSMFGFSGIVANVFSAFGYAGLVLLVSLFVTYFRDEKGRADGFKIDEL